MLTARSPRPGWTLGGGAPASRALPGHAAAGKDQTCGKEPENRRVVLLGLTLRHGGRLRADFIGTGMHGGAIYLRGGVDPEQLGREVGVTEPDDGDLVFLADAVGSYAAHFQVDPERILKDQFVKLYPKYLRPYGRLYAS